MTPNDGVAPVPPLHDLSGRVAVVTGGASGIGKGIARVLVSEGMRVVISDIEPGPLAATAGELGIEGIVADVTEPDQVQRVADQVTASHGTVHLIVNNAGVGSMGKFADLTIDDWRWMMDVNLFGVIHGVLSFLPVLRANPDGGHIVNTASMAGLTVLPGMGAYTASKFAVVGLTEVLAAELAAGGVRVGATVLCPGPVRSNIKDSLRTRPAARAGGLFDIDLSAEGPLHDMRWMDPLDCGRIVVSAVRRGDLYAITHPELWPQVAARHAALKAAFIPVQAPSAPS